MEINDVIRWIANNSNYKLEDDMVANNKIFLNDNKPMNALIIDLNSAIHSNYIFRLSERSTLKLDLAKRILANIEKHVKMMKPKKLLYMCFDGVPSMAKVPEQRGRRWDAYNEDELDLDLKFKDQVDKDKDALRDQVIYRNEISHGTDLMLYLSDYLELEIAKKIVGDHINWTGFQIYISNSNEPGEGEEKIITYINRSTQSIGLGYCDPCVFSLAVKELLHFNPIAGNRMGVPHIIKWLEEKRKKGKPKDKDDLYETLQFHGGIDNLYLDLNWMLLPLLKLKLGEGSTLKLDLAERLLANIEKHVKMMMLKKLIYMCFDGVLCLAKVPE